VRRAALCAALVLALALAGVAAGCGGEAGDLMLVRRNGSIPAARLDLRFTQDGRVACNRAPLRQLTSAQTLAARDIQRRLAGKEGAGPATRHVDLRPGPGAILRYRVSMDAGDVAFSDTSRRQPRAFYELARLTREVAQSVCHQPR
jgi:hypothetical protein